MKGWIKCLALLVGLTLHIAALAQSTNFVPLVPARLMDTRPGNSTVDGQFAGSGPLASWTTTNLTVAGRSGIPSSGVGAVALNITVTDPMGAGFLTAWPAGASLPNASNLNFVPGLAVSNQVIAKVGANGQVSIYLYAGGGTANVVADVTGYFPTSSDLTSLTPARLLDTRSGMNTIDGQFAGSGAVAAGGTLGLTVLGRGGVPASGVSAVVVNVTATGATASTFVTAWRSGDTRPNASNLNVVGGQTIPNLVMVAPGADGKISLFNNAGSTDLIVDVVGYFSSTTTFAPLLPARLLDTRPGFSTVDGQFSGTGAIGSGGTQNLTVIGRGGVPIGGVGAVALNITAVTPSAAGYLTAWGTGTTIGNAPPQTMAVNFAAGAVIPSLVIAQVGPNGQVSISNSLGSTNVIVDVVGWFPQANQYLLNGSFESPALSAGSYQYSPSGTGWTFSNNGSGGSGISSQSSAFTGSSPEIPLGNQVAFLQNQGCISETRYLLPQSILAFNATQRVNYGAQLQSVAVYVNNIQQPITVGSTNGAYTTYTITPPRNYYSTYAINLSSVSSGGTYTVKICGTVSSGDATALLDTVAISTPSNRAFGLWDPNGLLGTWRSDYSSASELAQFDSTCQWQDGVYGVGANSQYGWDGGPACKGPISWSYNNNWFSSNSTVAGPTQTPYVAGLPYWQVIVNSERYTYSECGDGPPDQKIPLQPRGATSGARFDILDNNSLRYPSLGANKIYQLVYLTGSAGGITGGACIPYLAFSANSKHGNGKPIAIMDSAGYFRPHLQFKEASFNSTRFSAAYVVISISGFDDNIDRAVFLVLGVQDGAFYDNYPPDYAANLWNWQIRNSKYYPGWNAAFLPAAVARSRCGFSTSEIPDLSFTNQWIPSGQSPSSISSYDIDLYKLIKCVAQETVYQGYSDNNVSYKRNVSGWGGASSQLPNPLVIDNVEWAIETFTDNSANSPWTGFWGMNIQ